MLIMNSVKPGLYVIATPIGNPGDFSMRAIEILREADLVVGEELKALRQILKAAGVQARAMDQLNEHSTVADIEFLTNECRDKAVALVSDCGTPGFCDPGADLVRACRWAGLAVFALPGASSLMALLSVAGVRVDQFVFFGFLPAKADLREGAWKSLASEARAMIVMETPYRCGKFLEEMSARLADRFVVVGMNLTQESERVWRGRARDLPRGISDAEPIVLICAKGYRE